MCRSPAYGVLLRRLFHGRPHHPQGIVRRDRLLGRRSNDVRHVFVAAAPRRGTTFDQQARDALQTIAAVTREEGVRGSIVHQAVFLADAAQAERCRQIMREFYGSELPATSYIPQPPCEGKLLAIEALGVGRGRGEVEIERRQRAVGRRPAQRHRLGPLHAGRSPQTPTAGVYDATRWRLRSRSASCSASVGVRFDQVIRTWLYLGGIVEDEGARAALQGTEPGPGRFLSAAFSSSTAGRLPPRPRRGLSGQHGHRHRGPRHDAQAPSPWPPSATTSAPCRWRTPGRRPPTITRAAYSPQSPKFSRAMVLSCGTYATIFISGTASITDSETRHAGDAAAQTHQTLDNIAALIAEENVCRHGLPGLGTSLASLGLVRVYVKRPEDYAAVRAVCRQRLGELPTIYAVADVCRPDLLVEIEGVAFSRLGPSPGGTPAALER